MKVIWLCNSILKHAANKFGMSEVMGISWIDSMIDRYYGKNEFNINIIFPMSNMENYDAICDKNITYYPFNNTNHLMHKYYQDIEIIFENMIKEIKPNIIHIFGTEYPHTLAMMRVVKRLQIEDKTVINIQGLCSFIAKHYNGFLPNKVIHSYTFRDLLKRDNIYQQQKKFICRGIYEREAIKLSENVIGRTVWDKACVENINPDIRYFKCNETMRDIFYTNKWSLDKCEKYTIFISQSYYPLKGFHLLIEAVSFLKKRYPDIKIYTTGNDIFRVKSCREGSYLKYIKKLIMHNDLKNNVIFLGNLDEKEMCEMYLKAHIFVSASTIENSSNSLSEAMLLGVPCIASDVGGTISLLNHEKEGYLYQADAPYLLSYYINKIFKDDLLAEKFSTNSRKHALITHDREKNFNDLIDIYKELIG